MPAEQAADTRLDLRLEVGSVGAVERDRRLDRFGLRPAARQPVERQALPGDRRISKPGGAVEAVGDRRGVELAGERDEIALAALAGEIDQQRRPFEMVARLGPVALAVGRAASIRASKYSPSVQLSASKKWLRKRSMMRAARRR